METMLHEVAEKLQAPVEDIPKKIAELDENLRTLRKTVKTLSEKLIVYRAAEIRSVGISVDRLLLYISEEEYDDEEYLIKLAAEIVKIEKPAVALAYAGTPSAKVVAVANDKAVEAGVNVGEVLRRFLQLAGGGGGGSRTLGRGAAPTETLVSNLPELSNLLRNTRGPR